MALEVIHGCQISAAGEYAAEPNRFVHRAATYCMLLLRHQNRPVVLVTGAIELVADIDADRAPANLSCVVERTLA